MACLLYTLVSAAAAAAGSVVSGGSTLSGVSSTPCSSSSGAISSAGNAFLKALISAFVKRFQTASQSFFTSRQVAVSFAFLELYCDSRPPHFVVHMLANQHWSSLSTVPLSSQRPGCVNSFTSAVLKYFWEPGTSLSKPLPQVVSGCWARRSFLPCAGATAK